MGEGAGVLLLEDLEFARSVARPSSRRSSATARGRRASHHRASAGRRRADPRHPPGAQESPPQAWKEVDYINAHGTSTLSNDRSESAAINTGFGEHAPNLPISSTKSMTGIQSARLVVSTAFTVLTLVHGILPPTINL